MIHRMGCSDDQMQRGRFFARQVLFSPAMRRFATAIACLVLAGCKRDAPRDLKIRYAAVTEKAANGTNDNFFSIDEDHALLVLADTAAASPGADPAKQAADGVVAAYKTCDGARLVCAVRRVNRTLADAKAGTTALAAAALEGGDVLVSALGDVAVV